VRFAATGPVVENARPFFDAFELRGPGRPPERVP
jgi:hypothetical protein